MSITSEHGKALKDAYDDVLRGLGWCSKFDKLLMFYWLWPLQ
jgi:hypothetical protein